MMTGFQKWFLVVVIIFLLVAAGGLVVYSDHAAAVQIRDRLGINVDDRLIVRFLDIGQGDAILLRLPDGEDVLVDGGPDRSVLLKLGRYLPWYDRRIERMIITHPHGDHIIGLIAVLRRYQVGEVITTGVLYDSDEYDLLLAEIEKQKIPVQLIEAPTDIDLADGIRLEFIRPADSLNGRSLDNVNNASLVFRLVYGEDTLLMMGDYEEEETLVSEPEKIKSDLLKVGHHGSSNGSDRDFIMAVDPDYGIISAGVNNQYGHPDFRTLYNLDRSGADSLRTDQLGDIIFGSAGRGWQLISPAT